MRHSLLIASALITLSVACGGEGAPEDDPTPAGATSDSTSTPPPDNAPSSSGEFPSSGESTPASECSDASKDIFVISNDFDLYRFNPATLAFTLIGPLDCIGPRAKNFFSSDRSYMFFGMGVNRAGHGWLSMMRYTPASAALSDPNAKGGYDQALVDFDTSNASCTQHDYHPIATDADMTTCMAKSLFGLGDCGDYFKQFATGLTYAAIAGGGEQLFGFKNDHLVAIDPTAEKFQPLGADVDQQAFGPFAGTGDGGLFRLEHVRDKSAGMGSTKFPFSLTKVDRTTAAKSDVGAIEFDSYIPIAMTFWGGDFWMFGTPVEKSGLFLTAKKQITVKKYETKTKSLTTVIDDVGKAVASDGGWTGILGAANSTCAPLIAPK